MTATASRAYNAAYNATLVKISARRPLTESDMFDAHLAAASYSGTRTPLFALYGSNGISRLNIFREACKLAI